MMLRLSSISVVLAVHAMVRTNGFKHEWLESGRDLWGVRCGDDVEMYVAWSKEIKQKTPHR
jgi:hypothetical protein